jgi:hypothetical protein
MNTGKHREAAVSHYCTEILYTPLPYRQWVFGTDAFWFSVRSLDRAANRYSISCRIWRPRAS